MKHVYDMNLSAGRRLFLEDYWLDLAGFAYAQYRIHGRGAVLINSSGDTNDLLYVDQASTANYPEIHDVIKEYDPKLQIVVLITLPDSVVLETYMGVPPPPSAYLAMTRRKKKR